MASPAFTERLNMNEEIEIAEAGLADAAAVARLSYQVGKMHDEALPDYFYPTGEREHLDIIRKMLKDEIAFVLKAVCSGKICGFACLYVQDRPRKGFVCSKIGYIYNFGVDEACRGRGIGTKLLTATEEYLRQKGVEAVDLNVFCFNRRALSFYKKCGYDEIDVNLRKVLGVFRK